MVASHIGRFMPTAQDTAQASHARQAIAAGQNLNMRELPPAVIQLLMEALEATAAGHAVSLVTLDAEMTPRQAAEILNVSRPFVVKMIETNVLPARKVGAHYRLPSKEVLAYKSENRARRLDTLAKLSAYDQELGLE